MIHVFILYVLTAFCGDMGNVPYFSARAHEIFMVACYSIFQIEIMIVGFVLKLCFLLGRCMKKNVVFAYLLWIMPLLLSSSAFGNLPDAAVKFVKDTFFSKVSTGISAASGVAMQAIKAMEDGGSSVSLPRALADIPRMKEDSYTLARAVDVIEIKNGGMLLLSRGKENALSCITLPENKKRVICHHNKNSLILGVERNGSQGDEFDHRSCTTIFRLTYVDKMPSLKVFGQAVVNVSGSISGGDCLIMLDGSSSFFCASVSVDSMKIVQAGSSKLKIDNLSAKSLDVRVEGVALATLAGINIENVANVVVNGRAPRGDEASPTVRLQGKVNALGVALGAHAVFDARECPAQNVRVVANKPFSSASVNVLKELSVEGKKSFGFVEYSGSPIIDSTGLAVRPSPIPTLLSALTEKLVEAVVQYEPSHKKSKNKAKKHAAVAQVAPKPVELLETSSDLLDPLN